jgi:hypothetical protein
MYTRHKTKTIQRHWQRYTRHKTQDKDNTETLATVHKTQDKDNTETLATVHKTQDTRQTKHNTKQKTKKMSNTDLTKNRGGTKCIQYCWNKELQCRKKTNINIQIIDERRVWILSYLYRIWLSGYENEKYWLDCTWYQQLQIVVMSHVSVEKAAKQ